MIRPSSKIRQKPKDDQGKVVDYSLTGIASRGVVKILNYATGNVMMIHSRIHRITKS